MKRDVTLDVMKGVGILLIVSGHLVNSGCFAFEIIGSFHVPLFFLIGGYLARDLTGWGEFRGFCKKSVKRLIVPYAITMLMLCVWGALQAFFKQDINYFMQPLFSMLLASADGYASKWGLLYVGPMWFLWALFVARVVFGCLQVCVNRLENRYKDIIILCICFIISIIVSAFGKKIPHLPFCIKQGLVSLSFYAFGYYMRRHPMPIWMAILCLVVWPIAILYGGVGMEGGYLHYYPLSFIGACGGTIAVYYLCKWLEGGLRSLPALKWIPRGLAWCGLYSLPILCMHELEMYSGFLYSWAARFPLLYHLVGWGEIGIAILMAIAVIHMPLLKKVYR